VNPLDVLSPSKTGELTKQVSLYDDFVGTLVDIEPGVYENEETGRITQIISFKWEFDEPNAQGEKIEVDQRYFLPTDEKTGELLIDEATGQVKRPATNSVWGRQEAQFPTMGIPWEGNVMNLLGIHARVQRKGERVTRDQINAERAAKARGEKVARRPQSDYPYGYYIVSWDFYNNQVRTSKGLEPILATYAQVAESAKGPESSGAPISEDQAKVQVAKIAIGKDFLSTLSEVRANHKDLMKFATRDAIAELVEEGMLQENQDPKDGGVVYSAGAALTV
jgi:hypothetical protein